MNNHTEEEWMQTQLTLQELMKYKSILREYCSLSVKPTLTEAEADRIDKILQQAEQEPQLSLLLDEADHIVAHQLHLIDESFITTQQQQFQMALDRYESEQLLAKLEHSSKSETAEVQTALKKEGLYTGAIDGVCGPRTREAVKKWRSRPTNQWLRNLISGEVWSTC